MRAVHIAAGNSRYDACQQEPLQALTLFAVAGELHSYSEVCEALSMLEVALGFLARTGGEPHMQLSCYLEEVLQMGDQMAQHILKVGLPEISVILSCSALSLSHRTAAWLLFMQRNVKCALRVAS